MQQLLTTAHKVADLIPNAQYAVTIEHIEAFEDALERLEKQLAKCPKLYETDGKGEHPAMFIIFTVPRIFISVSLTVKMICSAIPF